MKVSSTDLAKALAGHLDTLPAHEAASMLMGLVGAIVIKIDEGRWREMLNSAEAPCGRPDCDCEKDRMKFYETLDETRTGFQRRELEVKS